MWVWWLCNRSCCCCGCTTVWLDLAKMMSTLLVSTWIAEFLRMCSHKTTYTTVAISPSPRMFGLQNNNVKFCSTTTTTGSQIAYKIGSALWQQRRQRRRRRLIKSVTKKIINILQNGIWAKLFITLLCLASHLQADHIILCPVIKWAAYAAKHTLPLLPTHPPLSIIIITTTLLTTHTSSLLITIIRTTSSLAGAGFCCSFKF